ncbi:MAG: VCBS repeat-containing protein [Acidobacteriota bacterium]
MHLRAWLATMGLCVFCLGSPGNRTLQGGEIPRFVELEVEKDFGVGYAVAIADINRDQRPDIVAINPTQAVWFENPSWKRHVMIDGQTRKDNVCLAIHDIDADGRLDLALGAEWMPTNTQSGGTLQWLQQPKNLEQSWPLFPIGSEPTLHRIRWGDFDGDGRSELVVAPLQGRGTKGPDWSQGDGVRLLIYHPPEMPRSQPWRQEVVDQSLHSLHNVFVTNFDTDPEDEIIAASLEGVTLFDRKVDGTWTKRLIGEGNDDPETLPGAGEIKMGRFRSGRRYLATVEPWHGHQIVTYLPDPDASQELWQRQPLEGHLRQAHALACADVDGDGDDELIAGWREAPPSGRFGIALYDPQDGEWRQVRKFLVDDGGMATEDLAVADLNGDGRPDIVAVGRATHNVKIYFNSGARP